MIHQTHSLPDFCSSWPLYLSRYVFQHSLVRTDSKRSLAAEWRRGLDWFSCRADGPSLGNSNLGTQVLDGTRTPFRALDSLLKTRCRCDAPDSPQEASDDYVHAEK
jgi:hypothetical protein